ncbi:hypothetical protein [Brevibacillus agri]|uniref:hypothetical protein n=1 Tax=Brevibacillus agri TaxID=51101 RepID=UPI0018CDE5E3|nr:hypothetical protein [Brevibacillus agri]
MLKRFFAKAKDERGVTDLITLLIVLPTILAASFSIVLYVLFAMKMAKLEGIHFRALELAQQAGHLTPDIIADTQKKMAAIGFPQVVVKGVSYPSFQGSTTTKVYKDAADPTVTLVIKYPATNLQKIFMLVGADDEADSGFFRIENYGRSEAYETYL